MLYSIEKVEPHAGGTPGGEYPSTLLAALRRVGSRLPIMQDVVGFFRPNVGVQDGGDRVFGVLETSDARVNVGFDLRRCGELPSKAGWLRVSGKVWLGEKTSTVTLLVSHYVVVAETWERGCPAPGGSE
jgi:hypothetical protein